MDWSKAMEWRDGHGTLQDKKPRLCGKNSKYLTSLPIPFLTAPSHAYY